MRMHKKNNYLKYVIVNVLYRIGILFCIGAIIQAFMLEIGFSEKQVYLYNSIMQGIQVVVMFAMLFVADKVKNVKVVMAITMSSFVLLFVVLITGTVLSEITSGYLVFIFVLSAISYVGYGINSILSYVFPYGVFDMKDYGMVTGISGGVGGAVTFLVSIVHSLIVQKFDYNVAMVIFFIFAIICLIASTITCLSMSERKDNFDDRPKKDFAKVFKNKSIYILLIPNFLRGISTGIIGVITVIAISVGILDNRSSSFINVAMQLAIFIGNICFAFVCKKFRTQNLLMVSVMVVAILLPCTILNENIMLFFVLYGLMYLFMIIVDTSIPVLVTEIIPQDEIGAYTSIRMLIFTAGTSVATLIISPIIDGIGYVGLLIFASVCLFICGLGYFIVAVIQKQKKCKRKVESSVEENLTEKNC